MSLAIIKDEKVKKINIYWYYSTHFARHKVGLLTHSILGVKWIQFFRSILTLRLLMSNIYMGDIFLMFLDHTQRRSTVGRTPLDE